MEYVQMTLNDWMEMKDRLRRELQGVKQSFVRIGYALRKIDDGKLYEQDGYKSIAEFARAEYGLEPSTTSRFMNINREYSVDGYSERLRPEYIDLKRSQLEEMLNLPEADRAMITKDTPREAIRELKRFNAEPVQEETDDNIRDLIRAFYHDNPENLNDFFKTLANDAIGEEWVTEIICPSGSRTYKKYPYFMIMTEKKVSVKSKNTSSPQVMTWDEFADITIDIFSDAKDGENTWENYFGEKEDEPKSTDENEMESMGAGSGDAGSAAGYDKPESTAGRYTKPEEEETQGTPEGVQVAVGEDSDQLPPVVTQTPTEEGTKTATETEGTAETAAEEEPAETVAEEEPARMTAGRETAIEAETIEGEILEEKTVAPAQSDASNFSHLKLLDIEIMTGEREYLRLAYQSLAAVARRYPGDIRETTKGDCIYNTAMNMKQILDWEGVETEDLLKNYGVTD